MSSDKIGVDANDLEILKEEEFLEGSKVIYGKKYTYCKNNVYCHFCDPKDEKIASAIAKKIFESFLAEKYSEELFKKILANYSALCEKIISKRVLLTKQIYYCSKVIFLDIIVNKYPNCGIDESIIKMHFNKGGENGII